VAFEGTVMRILVVAAVIAASCALSGCFHFHTSQVVTAPQPLPPLK
jgi:outer membrane murein-binding lipoprotein Lpp